MSQTKKGNEWHCGMKMHIGVDDATRCIHSVDTTSANEHDITPLANYSMERRSESGGCGLRWY